MRNYSYLFARPLAFHRGISVRSEVPYTPYRPFASLPSCSLCALQPPSTAAVASSSAAAAHRFPMTMAGKSQILPADA
jgi:hypothetical protein